jgi:RpiR family carbohydrate utilization transcriptional regulator
MLEPLRMSDANLLLTIRALLPALNEQEQKVGQYILENPYEVVHLAISDLAQRCTASDATIFRFCKKVGADGYQDLKIRLAQELASARAATYVEITEKDSLAEAAKKVIAADVKALEDTLTVLNLVALERAAEALLAARRVDIYGSGGGAVAALELQYKLIRVGVRGVAHTDSEMQVISATLLSPDDVAVGISHSGTSRDIQHALDIAKQAGATLVAITNHPSSPVAEMADINLCTAAQESLAHGYPLGARVAQVALIDVLYESMSFKRRDETERSLAKIAQALYHRRG